MKLSDVVEEVIRLKEAMYQYWEREWADRVPTYPPTGPEEPEPPPAPEEQELREFLTSLPEDVIYKLFLLVDLGKKYYGVDKIAEEVAALKAEYPKVSVAIERFIPKSLLDYHLNEGLELLRAHGIDLDTLTPVKASA